MNTGHFYTNVSLPPTPVIDASEAIREAVKTEVKKTGLPFKALAVRAAKRIATPKRIAKHICSKIMKKLRLKMEEEGVTVHIEKVFRKGKDRADPLVLLLVFLDGWMNGWNIVVV